MLSVGCLLLLIIAGGQPALGGSTWTDSGPSLAKGTLLQTSYIDRNITLASNESSSSNWTRITCSPDGRQGAAMAYDTASGNALLFGGYNGTGYMNDTWSFNSSTGKWTKLAPTVSPPLGRVAPGASPAGLPST